MVKAGMKILINVLFVLFLAGCTTLPDDARETGYTQSEINWFLRLSLGYPYESHEVRLEKWSKPVIRIQLLGDIKQDDRNSMSELLAELHEVVPRQTFIITDESPDIRIYFVPQGKFNTVFAGRVDDLDEIERSWFAVAASRNKDYSLKEAVIAIASEIDSVRDRRWALRSLFIRSLGLGFRLSYARSQDAILLHLETDSLFMPGIRQGSVLLANRKLSAFERKMVSLAFDPVLQPGMTVQQIIDELVKAGRY